MYEKVYKTRNPEDWCFRHRLVRTFRKFKELANSGRLRACLGPALLGINRVGNMSQSEKYEILLAHQQLPSRFFKRFNY